jgi:hypothetical protein
MTAAYTIATNALTKSRAPSFIVPQGPTDKKGLQHGAPLLSLVIMMDYGFGAITVSIFLLDHGRAVPRLSLLDHGGMITIGRGPGIDHALRQPLRQRRPDRREPRLHPPTRASP